MIVEYLCVPLGMFQALKLLEVIGQGTFGIVHKAVWRGTAVAAKLINVPAGSEHKVTRELEMCRYTDYCVSVLGHKLRLD